MNPDAIFRALVENSSDMVSVIAPDGTLRFHYPPNILGYSEGENFGRNATEFIHPDDIDAAMGRLAAVIDDGGVSPPFEFRLRVADGSWCWVEAVGKNLCADPDIAGVVINSRDVTERRRADELERRAEALARSNRELEEFAYVASHDLAGPLRLIEAHARAVLEGSEEQLSDQARDGLEVIVKRAARMQELIDALLDCARVTAAAKIEPVSLCWVLDEAILQLPDDVAVDAEPLPTVDGDRSQLVQLFANLLANAVKFRRTDRPLQLQVWAQRDNERWVVGVDDNGVGVAPADRERAFRMFERLAPSAGAPGTGIGLALCARIVERHGGRMWLEEGIDGGAGVRIALPAQQ